MTDEFKELYEAAKSILAHLKHSEDSNRSDYSDMSTAELLETIKKQPSLVERLRKQAEKIEARDAAILRLRKAVKDMEPTQS